MLCPWDVVNLGLCIIAGVGALGISKQNLAVVDCLNIAFIKASLVSTLFSFIHTCIAWVYRHHNTSTFLRPPI